jgi:lipoprotein-anchoring transpeptidase ErfK/SrfK
MNRSTTPSRNRPFFLGLILVLGCAVFAAAAWSVNSTSAQAGISNDPSVATPTQRTFYRQVLIDKPTYTPFPSLTSSPTFLPTDIPTNTPEVMAYAEIIADTPMPVYAAYTSQQPYQKTDPAASSYSGNKYILIDISEQHMYVYAGDTQVFSFVSSTGMNNATRVGSFRVLDKIPNAYGATWNIWMPNWLGIYWAGSMENGIHALPILPSGATLWAGYLGTPISYGCIVIGAEEAQLLYNWAEVGTPVEIQR